MPVCSQISLYRNLYEVNSCTKLVVIFRDIINCYRRVYKESQKRLTVSSDNLFYVEDKGAPHNVRGGVIFDLDVSGAQDAPLFTPILFCRQDDSPATNGSWSHIDALESLFWMLINILQTTGETHKSQPSQSTECLEVDIYDLSAMEDKFDILANPYSLIFSARWDRPAMKTLVAKLAGYFQKILFWRWDHYTRNGADSKLPGLVEEAENDFDTLDKFFEVALDEIDDEDVQSVWQFVNKSISEDITKRYIHRSGR